MDRTLYLVLPQLRCRLSPPKTCTQLKLCEIERFCTESPESASPGLIAQSNRLRISNLVTFSTDQPAPKVRKNPIKVQLDNRSPKCSTTHSGNPGGLCAAEDSHSCF